MKATGLLLAVLVFAGCSDSSTDVHPAIVNMVDELAADGDCVNLQAAFDRSEDADELRYIDAALRDAGCYG